MSFLYETKVLEQFHVAPPPDSVPQPSLLPLTFFDVIWLRLPARSQRVFFYEILAISTSEFMHGILPKLKQSLSLALRDFHPFAGKLVCPAQPNEPYVLFSDGDSVQFTVVEATGDFNHLTADCEKDVKEFHPLVSDFPPSTFSGDGKVEYLPVLALQVTVFPSSGICIGITFLHVVADGKCSVEFMKSWASYFRSNNGDLSSSCLRNYLPSYGRDGIKDPYGLKEIYLNEWWKSNLNSKQRVTFSIEEFENKVRRTFLISRLEIEKLKESISRQYFHNNDEKLITPFQVSAFVSVCAFTWVCLLKSKAAKLNDSAPSVADDDEPVNFGFVADCRNRFGFNVPESYFGNCLATILLPSRIKDIIGESGLSTAAKLIVSGINELKNEDVHKVIHRSLSGFLTLRDEHFFSVAGSPKLGVYETDFGWGKPKRSEVVHIDSSKAIALAESRDGKAGVELALALSRNEMTTFTSIFEEGLKNVF